MLAHRLWAESLQSPLMASHTISSRHTPSLVPLGWLQKGYMSLLMQAQGRLRILARKEGKFKVFGRLKRLSGKFLIRAVTQGGPLQIFSPFHGSSGRNLRTVTYLEGWQGLRDMLAKKFILSWENIVGAHEKGGGDLMETGEGNKAPWLVSVPLPIPTPTPALGTAIESFGFPTWVVLCRPRIGLGILQWLALTWMKNCNASRKKVCCRG